MLVCALSCSHIFTSQHAHLHNPQVSSLTLQRWYSERSKVLVRIKPVAD